MGDQNSKLAKLIEMAVDLRTTLDPTDRYLKAQKFRSFFKEKKLSAEELSQYKAEVEYRVSVIEKQLSDKEKAEAELLAKQKSELFSTVSSRTDTQDDIKSNHFNIDKIVKNTPIGSIINDINKVGGDWNTNTRSSVKAYIMACLSEISYLQIADCEIKHSDRYKLFPSKTLELIYKKNIIINVSELVSRTIEAQYDAIFTDNYVYVILQSQYFLCIAVRGTQLPSLGDWMINFDAWIKSDYHRGFLNEADSALPKLKAAVSKFGRDDLPVYFTGHSLGGAIASIVARRWDESQCVMTPYVFGTPRFAQKKNDKLSQLYGYVSHHDIVPHLPPSIFGYTDAGFPKIVVPDSEKQVSGLRALFILASNLTVAPHYIELYRREAGICIGTYMSQDIYTDIINYYLTSSRANFN